MSKTEIMDLYDELEQFLRCKAEEERDDGNYEAADEWETLADHMSNDREALRTLD